MSQSRYGMVLPANTVSSARSSGSSSYPGFRRRPVVTLRGAVKQVGGWVMTDSETSC